MGAGRVLLGGSSLLASSSRILFNSRCRLLETGGAQLLLLLGASGASSPSCTGESAFWRGSWVAEGVWELVAAELVFRGAGLGS